MDNTTNTRYSDPASSEAGAPEISVEMIQAGAEVIWRCFDETIPYGSSFGERVAVLVFEAMHASRKSQTSGEY